MGFKELAERQKLQMRNKAIKKGLDPEAFTGKHPPTIRMFSKYERRTDTRSYGDRKKLYEGGAEVLRAEALESAWKDKLAEFTKRPARRLQRVVKKKPKKLLLRKKKRNTTKKKRKKRRRKRSKLSLHSSPGFLSRARHQTFHTSHCF